MRFLLPALLLVMSLALPAGAQDKERAQQYLLKANAFKSKKDTARAFYYAQRAITEYPAYDEAYSTLGVWLYDARYFQRASRVFLQAARQCRDGVKRYALPAARAYIQAQKPDSALFWLAQGSLNTAEAEKIRRQARMMIAMRTPTDTNKVYKLDQRINTRFPEFFPSLSADRQTLHFTRRINGVNEDFFYAHPDSCGGWLTARNLGYPPNTAAQESAQTISADDHYLFFMRSDNRSENGWGRGGCDLYLAYRVAPDSPWSVAESFGATINTPAFEGMPSLSPDIHSMFFVSDRPGGYGGLDIWVSHFVFGLWQLPVNLGPSINTSGNETAPFISSDNRTLYFASDGHPGLGGSDLFAARMINDSTWETPVNLGTPINSAADENSISVLPDGKKAYFASDRGNTDGNLDIYETTLPASVQPQSTAYALCYVYDSISKDPAMLGSITLYDTLGNELAMYHANKGDGSILMSLPVGKTFNFAVRGFNFNTFEGSINFPEPCVKWCTLNFALLPRNYVRPTYDSQLITVFFPKNVITLNDTQINAIRAVLQDWREKKDISIFVNSYTDNTGTPMINTEKSTIRAQVISGIIGQMGFDASLINATGFGDSNPIAPNDSPENQDKNRRAELIVRWSD